MLSQYRPNHNDNRMGHEGDLNGARKYYLNASNKNLTYLLGNRFNWMKKFINDNSNGIELGAGIGASKDFIQSPKFLISDFNESEWLDYKNVDALHTDFENASFDYIVASNLIHHLAKPSDFFSECARILKPSGLILIQEINSSLAMRLILRVMRHEGYDETTNVLDPDQICNNPEDLWSANCSIPKLLFKKHNIFENHFPEYEVILDKKTEFLIFINSGGVIAKTKYIPLPIIVLKLINIVDRFIIALFPRIFPLQRQIVLRKKND